MTQPGSGASLLAQIEREEEEREARARAQAALAAPSAAPDEAASILRDSEQLGLPPSVVGESTIARREARAAREADALDESPALRQWIADGGAEQAAAARDDFDVMAEMESLWSEAQEYGRRNSEIQRRQERATYEQVERFEADVRSLGTAAGRREAGAELSRSTRQLADNLSDPDWWKRQGEAAERGGRNLVRTTGRFFDGAAEDIREQPEEADRIYRQAQLGWRAIDPTGQGLNNAELAALDSLYRSETEQPRTPIGYAIQSWPLTASSLLEGAEQAAPMSLIGAGAGFTAGVVVGTPGPQIASPVEEGALTIAGLMMGARTGFVYGTGLESARQEAGLAYAEFRNIVDENGQKLDEQVARNAALMVGMANGALEVASIRAAIRALPGGEALLKGMTRDRVRQLLMRPTFRQALLRAGGRVGYVSAVEGLTEAAQELTLVAGGEFAMNADGSVFHRASFGQNASRISQAAYGGAQAGLVFGGAGASMGLAIDIPRARRAEQDAAIIDALASVSERSNLRRRLPERFHAWVDAVTQNGALDTIYVDAHRFRTFFQENEVDPAAVADTLEGVGREQYEQALAAHDDIAVPIATFATRIAGTPAYEGLREHMRLHPDADTLAEARDKWANDDTIQERLDAITREQDLQNDELEAQQLISRDLRRRLDMAGVTVSDANAIQAEAIARAIVVLSARGETNPIELYRRYWADIRGPFEDLTQIQTAVNRDVQQAGSLDVEGFARDIAAKHGLGDLRLTQRADGDIVLDVIGVEKKRQRRGSGSAAMAEIIAYADQHGVRLRATPPKRGGAFGTTSQARARGFLQRHGFVENKGKARDEAVSEPMYRPAQGKRSQNQAETTTGTPRFDVRAVEATEGGIAPTIPEVGTPEFVLLLETAIAKQEVGAPLSFLEQYAFNRVASGATAATSQEREYFSREGEREPVRAGPLPPRSRPDQPSDRVSLEALGLDTEQRQRLAVLIAERERLTREIEERMSAERDLPAVTEARRDAAAMRAASYCAAREVARDGARVRAIGGAIGGSAASVGGLVVAGTPTDTTDGPIPESETPAAAEAPEGGATSVVVPIPPPVVLPEIDTESAMAALPAEQAVEAELPETLSQASARAAEAEADLPIVTNNRAIEQ